MTAPLTKGRIDSICSVASIPIHVFSLVSESVHNNPMKSPIIAAEIV